jgi:hypothetical protein
MSGILIEKDGTISEKHIKTLDKLYLVCGYRTNKDFEKLYEWKFDENIYELYGKKNGKKDKENIFKLPIDSYKYYGSLCVIKKNGSISLDEWNMFYMSFTYSKDENKDEDQVSVSDYHESEEMDSIDSNDPCKFLKSDYEHINHNEIELTYEEYEEES